MARSELVDAAAFEEWSDWVAVVDRAETPAVRKPNVSTAILDPNEMESIRRLNGTAAIGDAER